MFIHQTGGPEPLHVLAALAAVLLLVPTAVVSILARHRPPERAGGRPAAWWCMFAAQLGLVQVGSVYVCLALGRDFLARGAALAALVYGLVMAAIIAGQVPSTLRLFVLGVRALGANADTVAPVGRALSRVRGRAVAGIVAMLVFTVVIVPLVPFPGRWTGLVYFASTVIPATGVCVVVVISTSVARLRLRRTTRHSR